jgi:5-(aminomethyl)-3-furanmethanol phosphate kinase
VKGPIVVKVGGSLLGWDLFPSRLSEYLASHRDERLVLVVGGGAAADLIRDLDRRHGLGDEESHRLALHALDLTARVLEVLVSGLEVAAMPEDLASIWEGGRIPLLAPRKFLERDDRQSIDPLPHTWAVTTDSIAARLARHLCAAGLVLLKSAPLPPGFSRLDAARAGLVDPTFPLAAEELDHVHYVNLREPTLRVCAL